MNELSKDYLWTGKIGANYNYLYEYLLKKEEDFKNTTKWPNLDQSAGNKFGSFTTANFKKYNVLTFPSFDIQLFYFKLKNAVLPLIDRSNLYMIQCWFNVFRKGEYLDWHEHWGPNSKSYHGYYNVYSDPSTTHYLIPGLDKEVVVENCDDLLVFGKSEGDKHKTSTWTDSKPRITIAFDLVPINLINIGDDHVFVPF